MNTPSTIRRLLFDAGLLDEVAITGISMVPTLHDGDKIRIHQFSSAVRLLPAHIYIYIHKQRLIVHRLICKKGGHFLFMGDNCRRPDRVGPEAIIAEYILPESNFKKKCVQFCNYMLLYSFSLSIPQKLIFKIKQQLLKKETLHEKKIC